MIIFLNGTSSSGKSAIAKELLNKLNEPYFYFSVDTFLEPSMPTKINMDIEDDIKLVDQAISGFNKALGVYAKSIKYMIVDHVLHQKLWVDEVAMALNGNDVFFVGVVAPLSVLEKREAARRDRQPGTAKPQFYSMQDYQYDFTVDTSINSPSEAALMIIERLRAERSREKCSTSLLK